MTMSGRSSRMLGVCALAAIGLFSSVGGRAAGSPAWRAADVWDDGNAEFCVYDVDWSRYGQSYPGQANLITVKEPWAPNLEVKSDTPRGDGFEVIKLNHVRDVQTGIYTYHQMASAFVRRDDGRLRKLSVTSSEGCGISTAHLVDGRLNTRSYFDGQGERNQDYPAGAIPEDALPLALREFVHGAVPDEVVVFPSLMTGRFPALEPASFAVERSADSITTRAGRFAVARLELERPGRSLSFAFDRQAPHKLVAYSDSDGTTYSLAKCERIPYWRMNAPGGEDWLPPDAG